MDLILLLLKIREWCQHVLLSHQYLSSSKHIKNHKGTVIHIKFGTHILKKYLFDVEISI